MVHLREKEENLFKEQLGGKSDTWLQTHCIVTPDFKFDAENTDLDSDLFMPGWWGYCQWSDEDCCIQKCHNVWSNQWEDHDWSPASPGCIQSLCLSNGSNICTQPQLPKRTGKHFWGISNNIPWAGWSEIQSKGL